MTRLRHTFVSLYLGVICGLAACAIVYYTILQQWRWLAEAR